MSHEHEKTTIPVGNQKTTIPIRPSKAEALATVAAEDVAPPPAITALVPASAAVGDPSFGLHVRGTGFNTASVIVFAGQVERTTCHSDGDLSTGMNMPLWQGADQLSVQVRNADGQESNTVTFDLLPPRAVPIDPAEASKPSPAIHLI